MTSTAKLATPEGAITFWPSTASVTPSVDFSFEDLEPNGTDPGWQSAEHNFGTSARAYIFEWRAWWQTITAETPTLGDKLEFWLKTSDGTVDDNDEGATDVAMTSVNKFKNLKIIGAVRCDEAAADVPFSNSGTIIILAQYIQICVISYQTTHSIDTDVDKCGFTLIPHAVQGQAT